MRSGLYVTAEDENIFQKKNLYTSNEKDKQKDISFAFRFVKRTLVCPCAISPIARISSIECPEFYSYFGMKFLNGTYDYD